MGKEPQTVIGVRDVVAHLGCSRRLADLRFGELQRMSILDARNLIEESAAPAVRNTYPVFGLGFRF